MAIDYNELEQSIRTMSVRSQLYKVLKTELSKRGYWKNRVRGFHVRKAESVQITRNKSDQPVMLQGLLPNGTYGIMIDEAKPFTEKELKDSVLFNKHLDDLNKRVDSE